MSSSELDEAPRKRRKEISEVWEDFEEIHTSNKVSHHRISCHKGEDMIVCKCKHCDYIHPYPKLIHVEYAKKHSTLCSGRANKTSLSQSKISDSTMKKLLPSQQDSFNEILAQWFYETGTPFFRVENKKLLEAIYFGSLIFGIGKKLLHVFFHS